MRWGALAALVTATAVQVGSLAPAGVIAIPRGLDAYMPVPEANPLRREAVALGRRLFFDPQLSATGELSCAGCHDPAKAFSDGRPTAVGVQGRRGRRNVPAIVNRGYGRAFFWDGRAATLEAQVLEPIEGADEMGSPIEIALSKLARDPAYAAAFRAAFGRPMCRDDLARALATFVRSILAGDSPVDRFLSGDGRALSDDAVKGLRLFRGKGHCTLCHLGPTLSDERFHNTGVAWKAGAFGDVGRAAITGRQTDRGAFKTPTLREVSRTAPYMHDGSIATLAEVIEHYDRGGTANPALDPELRPLGLVPEEKTALVAFLRALTGRVVF